jgi:hypothetical protein
MEAVGRRAIKCAFIASSCLVTQLDPAFSGLHITFYFILDRGKSDHYTTSSQCPAIGGTGTNIDGHNRADRGSEPETSSS